VNILVRALLLDTPGLLASLAIGLIVIWSSKELALANILLLITFLVISVIATKYRYEEKKEKGVYEHERGWHNVVSNGAAPMLCCVGYFLTGSNMWIAAYITSVAGALSDKFGSELGVLSGKPIALRNLKIVKAGTSGAISTLGTFLSFIAALLIGVAAYPLYKFEPTLIFYIAVGGFLGSVFDTIAGIFEEMGIGNKSTSNLICTISSALIGYYFIKL